MNSSDRLRILSALPYRGVYGAPRPPWLSSLPLPPEPMPSRDGLRPLKAWRYVGVYGPEVMLCAALVRIGPAVQSFWAVWDRKRQLLFERTRLGRGEVTLGRGRVRIISPAVTVEVELEETTGIEAVCVSGKSYAWTRKQGGIRAQGAVAIDGSRRQIVGRAVIDDSAGYHERHTRWRWSAGVGVADSGQQVAWNLVEGVNDPSSSSERTVWVEHEAQEPPRSRFAPDLSAVDALAFSAEAIRERRENLVLVRSHYRQPFGTFKGQLPGGLALAEGYGVMEDHDVWW